MSPVNRPAVEPIRGASRQEALFEAGIPDGDGPYVGVVLNRPVDIVLTYRVPARLASTTKPGARVLVPLGRGNNPAVAYCVTVGPERTKRSRRIALKKSWMFWTTRP